MVRRMKIIEDEAAVLVGKTLVVADLHNGLEYELFKRGAQVPSQTEEKLERLSQMLEGIKPKRLVILGDLKHNIPITSEQERREVPEFLSAVSNSVDEVIITKGNHDGAIERLVPEGVTVVDELIEGGVGFFHGHKRPSKELLEQELIICAHTHPAVALADIKKSIQPVWVETRTLEKGKGVLVVPAFDRLIRGTPLNVEAPLGPFLRKMVDMEGAEVYLLDGSYLGELKSLR